MSLEEDLRLEMQRTMAGLPAMLELEDDVPQKTNAIGILHDFVLPIMNLQREMILRLAGEIDRLRGTT